MGAGDVLFVLADADARAEGGEPSRHLGFAQVGPAHRIAEVEEHLGDAGHADAADADEVDGDVAVAEHGISGRRTSGRG